VHGPASSGARRQARLVELGASLNRRASAPTDLSLVTRGEILIPTRIAARRTHSTVNVVDAGVAATPLKLQRAVTV
jgi:hypothetical protein